jgi:hypothetical protein
MQRAADADAAPAPPEPNPQDSPPADPSNQPPPPADAPPEPEPSPPEPSDDAGTPGPDTSATGAAEPTPDLFDIVGDPDGSLRQRFGGDQSKLLESLANAHHLVGKHAEELKEYRELTERLGEDGVAALRAGKSPGQPEPATKGDPLPTWSEFQLLQQQVLSARQNSQEVPADLQRRYERAANAVGQTTIELAAKYPTLQKMLGEYEAGQLGGGVPPEVLEQRMAETERKRAVREWAQQNRSKLYDDAGRPTSLGDQVNAELTDLCRLTGREPKGDQIPLEMFQKALTIVESRQPPPKPSPKTGSAATRKPDAAPPDKVPQTDEEFFSQHKGKNALADYHLKGPGARQG